MAALTIREASTCASWPDNHPAQICIDKSASVFRSGPLGRITGDALFYRTLHGPLGRKAHWRLPSQSGSPERLDEWFGLYSLIENAPAIPVTTERLMRTDVPQDLLK